MEILQFDIGTAYLNGKLHEVINMKQPEASVEPKDNRLCKLLKALYALRQLGRQWNIYFDTFMKKYNLI